MSKLSELKSCPKCGSAKIMKLHDCTECWGCGLQFGFADELQNLLARAYSQLFVNNSSLIVERKPGDRRFLDLVGR